MARQVYLGDHRNGAVGRIRHDVAVPEAKAGDADGIGRYRMQFPETSARYLKVVAQNAAAIPAWHPGAGSKGFLFVDEVGAGVIFIALGYSLGGPALIISVLTLVLNLILTGGFVVWVKKLALRSYTPEPEA